MHATPPAIERFHQTVLRDVVARLSDPKAVLTLHVGDGLSERLVNFTGGGVRVLSLGERAGPEIHSHLLARGIVDVDRLHSLLERCRKQGSVLGDALLEEQIVTADAYAEITRTLVTDEICSLVHWEDAFYTCSDGSPPEETYDRGCHAISASLPCDELAESVSRWLEKWAVLRSILHGDLAMVRRTTKGHWKLEKVEGEERQLLVLAGDPQQIRTLWKNSGQSLCAVCERLSTWTRRGWVEVLPPIAEPRPELIPRVEANLPRFVGKEMVCARLDELHRTSGSDRSPAGASRAIARAALHHEEWDLAARYLEEVLQLEPSDIGSLEDLVKVRVHRGHEKNAVRAAYQHARRLLGRGLLQEAMRVARVLETLKGGRLDAQDIEAGVLARSGNVQGASARFVALATECETRGDRRRAAILLDEALRWDPNNAPAIEKARNIRPTPELEAEVQRAGVPSIPVLPAREESRQAVSMRAVAGLVLLVVGTAAIALGVLLWTGRLSSRSASASPDEAFFGGPGYAAEHFESLGPTLPEDARSTGLGSRRLSGPPPSSPVRSTSTGGVDPERQAIIDRVLAEVTLAAQEREKVAHEEAKHHQERAAPEATAGEAEQRGGGSPVATAAATAIPWSGEDVTAQRSLAAAVEATPGWMASNDRLRPPCPHGERHEIVLRPVDARRAFAWGRSCDLVAIETKAGRQLFRLEGKPGHRWAVSFRGELVCRWQPRKNLVMFRPANRLRWVTQWTLPPNTDAVAIGREGLAVRFGDRTRLVGLDGNIDSGAVLPVWDSGYFVDDHLVLLREPNAGTCAGALWVVRPEDWAVLWSCADLGDTWSVR